MIELIAPAQTPIPTGPLGPEAVAILVNAVTTAQYSAYVAAVVSVVTLIILLLLGAVIAWMVYKFANLEHQTNSLMDALIKSTGAEALARGIKEGRQSQQEENENR